MKNGFMPKMVLLDGNIDVDYSGGVHQGGSNYADEYVDASGNHWIYFSEEACLDWGLDAPGYYRDDFSEYYGPSPDPTWTPV